MVVHRLNRRLPLVRLSPEIFGVMAMASVMLLTMPFSIWPGGALGTFTDVYFKVVLIFILMVNSVRGVKALRWFTWLILAAMGYVAARGVLDFATGNNLIKGERLHGSISGLMGNPNDLAMNMVTFMPVAAIIAVSREQSVARRLVAAVIVALMLATIVFTRSRAGVIGLVVMLGALVLLGGKVRRGFGAIAVASILAATPFLPASFWVRMQSMFDEKQDKQEFSGSSEARRIVMLEGIATFGEYPFTGVGAGQFKNYNPAGRKERWRETHNALIQVAAETGVLGLLAFSFLILRAALAAAATRRMLRRPRKRGDADPLALVLTTRDRTALYNHTVAMTAGLIGWFACSLFSSIAYNWTFYYVLALIVAARELTRDRLLAANALRAPAKKPVSVPAAKFSRRVAPGVA
jgi:O-antigen ligase